MSSFHLLALRSSLWLGAALFLCFMALPLQAQSIAQGADGLPLFAGEARVDVLGSDPNDARLKAFAEARRLALKDLLDKFVPEHSEFILRSVSEEQLNEMAKSIEVVQENAQDKRYRGDLRVNFDSTLFQQLLESKLKALKEDREVLTLATLVLPVFDTGTSLLLFETSNDWGKIWQEMVVSVGNGLLVAPYSDSIDYSTITASNVLKADYDGFAALLRRYGARDVVVLNAKMKPANDTEGKRLEVSQRRIQASSQDVRAMVYPADYEETDLMLMQRAARDIALHLLELQGLTKQAIQYKQDKPQTQLVLLPLTTMQSYAQVRHKIAQAPGVDKIEIKAITPSQVDLELYYHGDKDALLEGLKSREIKVQQLPEYWSLQP